VDGRSLFLNVQMPPIRLVVIGAVHISQALAPMAKGLDLDVTVVDPRTAFATAGALPGRAGPGRVARRRAAEARRARPLHGRGMPDARPQDRRPRAGGGASGRVLLYRGARLPRTHAKRVERLQAAGFSEADIARIHAPIGLDIGAVSPAEIGVSVLAELVAELRRDRRRRP
jgi:xanthine dehydrogenase accessory factor